MRIQDIIHFTQDENSKYPTETVSHNLDLIFENLSGGLSGVLSQIELLLSHVDRAVEIATTVARQLLKENQKILTIKESASLWRKLLEPKSAIAKQLNRDLSLTAVTVESLTGKWRRLEALRDILVAYRKNVELFKVRLSFVQLNHDSRDLIGRIGSASYFRRLSQRGVALIINCQQKTRRTP